MRAFLVALVLALLTGGACGESSDQTAAPDLTPAPRVAPTEEPDELEEPGTVEGEAPQPQPPKSGSKPAATALCKALSDIASADDPEVYIAGLRDEAVKAGFGFERLIVAAVRALAAGKTEKAGNIYGRLGTLCEEVTGRRNF